MPKISVIVPIYNTEKYLEKCLISLINQTLCPPLVKFSVRKPILWNHHK